MLLVYVKDAKSISMVFDLLTANNQTKFNF